MGKRLKVIAILVVVSILVATLAGCAGGGITFAEPNLEAAIRQTIGKREGTIYQSDLEELTSLQAIDRGIIDITGLEDCTGLTRLVLEDNQIGDITPLSDLINLELLDPNGNQVSDITPLENLTSLSYLYLADNGDMPTF
jgi:internalin A